MLMLVAMAIVLLLADLKCYSVAAVRVPVHRKVLDKLFVTILLDINQKDVL